MDFKWVLDLLSHVREEGTVCENQVKLSGFKMLKLSLTLCNGVRTQNIPTSSRYFNSLQITLT